MLTLSRFFAIAFTVSSAVLAVLVPAQVAAQDALSFFSRTAVSGYVDTSYAYNLNQPATPCQIVNGVAVFNCLHAFDVARNAFSLNLASLALEKTPAKDSRGGFRIDLAYGQGVALNTGAESGRRDFAQNVLQAYVSVLAGSTRRLQVDFGKFVTPAGIERIDPGSDWNASRSLLFALAIPREHVGLRAVYAPADWLTVTGLLTNGWSDVAENAGARRVGVSVSVRPARGLTVTETYLRGPESRSGAEGWRDLSDTAATWRATGRLSLAFNADVGRDRSTLQSWQGAAAYMRIDVNDWLAITPRVEGLRDRDGFMTRVSQDLQEAGATAEFRHSQATALRLEYRIDVADGRYFLKGVSSTVKTQRVFVADWVFRFNSHGPSRPEQDGLLSALREK